MDTWTDNQIQKSFEGKKLHLFKRQKKDEKNKDGNEKKVSSF